MSVLIDTRARAAIARESRRRRVRETGGALFGFLDGEVVIVACAYGPGPRARHRRASFEAHRTTTEAVMQAVRGASRQRYRFLGSWHTHPGGAAVPSWRDISTAREIAEDEGVRLPSPLVVIQATRRAGQAAEPTDLAAWRWDAAARTLKCSPVEAIELEQRWCPTVDIAVGRQHRALCG